MDVINKLSICMVVAFLAGCGDGTTSDSPPANSSTDEKLSSIIKNRGLTSSPVSASAVPAITDPIAQLGKRLFFSKSLSGDRDTACVTCHHPQLGGGDNLSLPIGVAALVTDLLGPGRTHRADGDHFDGGPTVPRNIAFAIGEYQRSQLFTTSPWKQYVKGNKTVLSKSAKSGALLFLNSRTEGGAGCANCHTGDFFTDEAFHNIGIPQLGRGKGDGAGKEEDFGRFRETKLPADKFAFRTPSLLNVEMTGPWGHSGAYTSLETVVRHHLNPQSAVSNYDAAQLSQVGLQSLDKVKVNTQKALDHSNFALREQRLSDDKVNDLVNFLNALTDPCTLSKGCLSPWILDEKDDPDPNGDQLKPIGAGL